MGNSGYYTTMTHPDAVRWNKRYREEAGRGVRQSARPLLRRYLPRLPRSGLALDAAAGLGSNGLLLARRGMQVIALDVASAGLRRARRRFAAEGLRLDAAVYDLSRPWLPNESFDVILNFRFLERATFPVYRRALRGGGWLLFATFVKIDPDADYPEHYLEPGELRAAFDRPGLEILHSEQRPIYRNGRLYKMTDQLVARKTLP